MGDIEYQEALKLGKKEYVLPFVAVPTTNPLAFATCTILSMVFSIILVSSLSYL